MCNKCSCCHDPDLGACPTFESGSNGRCVFCDHDEGCHPGVRDRFNTPLGQELYHLFGPSIAEVIEAVGSVNDKVTARNMYNALQQCKIVASWDSECGCSVRFARNSLSGLSGYINSCTVNGSVYLVWSLDWIPQRLAELAVKRLVR